MLRTRIITAVVLLAVLLPALFAPTPWPFAILTLVAVGAAGWEWGRLNGAGDQGALIVGALVALACLGAIALGFVGATPPTAWWIALLVWVVCGSLALRAGPAGWPRMPSMLRLAVGVLALVIAWLALAQARRIGVNFLLSIFALVWAADIAAYFGGRALGRRKLAPSISPGKSWEGVWSGMAGVLVLALLWIAIDRHFAVGSPSFYSHLLGRLGAVGFVCVLLFLAGVSVVGDLVESLAKRAAGAKDSSRLLPGHGGVLDRIDALLPVFPIALVFASL